VAITSKPFDLFYKPKNQKAMTTIILTIVLGFLVWNFIEAINFLIHELKRKH